MAQVVLQQRFVQAKARGTALVSNLRATLDATVYTINLDDYGVGRQANPTIVLASNANNGSFLGGFPSNLPPRSKAIAFDRTTRQVLNIAYGEQNASGGLFFPKGLNGAIRQPFTGCVPQVPAVRSDGASLLAKVACRRPLAGGRRLFGG